MNILLVSPATPDTFWSFRHVLPFVSRKAAFPPLGLLTVAGMLPTEWDMRLVDLNVRRLSDADVMWADYVLVSAMLVQEASAREVLARCAAHGKTVIAGGPLFTTGHARFAAEANAEDGVAAPVGRIHMVLGEAEDVMPQLIADLRRGELAPLYDGNTRPDLRSTPAPRWDLVAMRDYATMAVQFSRGCPFNCEFCDIVALYGRVPRLKNPQQLIGELDALLVRGWHGPVFIVDDNFIGHRPNAKALLRALVAWRTEKRITIPFLTEASVNLADDPELLELMVAAGFKKVFIGLETPEEASLAECAKNQNTNRNLLEAVHKIQHAGLEVMGGFIVGFDNDPSDICERQDKFIQSAGIVTAMVGLLNALPQTRLFERLQEEGRILRASSGNNLDAVLNFVPRLDRDRLLAGYRALVKKLYAPRAYYARALTFLANYRTRGPRVRRPWSDVRAFLHSLWVMGVWTRGRREYWKFMARSLLQHPRKFGEAMQLAIMGYHFRRIAAQL